MGVWQLRSEGTPKKRFGGRLPEVWTGLARRSAPRNDASSPDAPLRPRNSASSSDAPRRSLPKRFFRWLAASGSPPDRSSVPSVPLWLLLPEAPERASDALEQPPPVLGAEEAVRGALGVRHQAHHVAGL